MTGAFTWDELFAVKQNAGICCNRTRAPFGASSAPGATPAKEDKMMTECDKKKERALAMASRLEALAVGLDRNGLAKEANINREKAASIRKAQA